MPAEHDDAQLRRGAEAAELMEMAETRRLRFTKGTRVRIDGWPTYLGPSARRTEAERIRDGLIEMVPVGSLGTVDGQVDGKGDVPVTFDPGTVDDLPVVIWVTMDDDLAIVRDD